MSHVFGKAVAHTFKYAESLPPVGRGKSPIVAAIVGLLFGAPGIGLYLRSWSDFFILMALFVFGTIFTGGVAAPICWAIAGAWGARRVMLANRATETSLDAAYA